MEKPIESVPFQWWWEHTRSARAGQLIELYWHPVNGSKAMKLFVAGREPKDQVKSLKRALERLGYRLFWRVVPPDVVAWVAPTRENAIRPPGRKTRT